MSDQIKFKWNLLFLPEGKVGRYHYALVGFCGFFIKHLIDIVIFNHMIDSSALPVSFLIDPQKMFRLYESTLLDQNFIITYIILSSPFIWVGLIMSINRLRDAGKSIFWSLFFFLPLLNILYFLILSLIPSQVKDDNPDQNNSFFDRLIPDNLWGAAAISSLISIIFSLVLTWISSFFFHQYGFMIFIVSPIFHGFLVTLLFSYHQVRRVGECISVTLVSLFVTGLMMLAFAFEGLICIIMASPIAFFMALFGTMIAYFIQIKKYNSKELMAIVLLSSCLFPNLMWAENLFDITPPIHKVVTHVDIEAPKSKIWNKLVAFSKIDEPTELLFKAGISYPTHAIIEGEGVGAVRHCVFTTGEFIEPITVWDEPNLLKFDVEEQPVPMSELTPYDEELDVPHLHGYFGSVQGQFLLTDLNNGMTRLEGTTWYYNDIWPQAYWRVWTEYILHKIHYRVLNHIKKEAEEL